MADYEVSKLMWMGIVIALAASVFTIAQPQISSLTNGALNTVSQVVNPSNSDNGGATVTKPDSNDPKWVTKGNYGTNGYFVMDKDGNGVVYALDPQQPIVASETAISFTQNSQDLRSLRFLDKTILPKNSSLYFADNVNLKTFDTKNLDTSNVTDMSAMFSNMSAVTSLDVSNFNTSNVTNMSGMFSGMKALTSLDVSNFNTSNVTNMSGMFYGTHALTALDVSNFNTSNVTDVAHMFGDRDTLTHPDTSKFDTSKMTDKDAMFDSVTTLPDVELNWDKCNASAVTSMSEMFLDASNLTSLDLNTWDVSKVNDMSSMFRGDLGNWSVTEDTNFDSMFDGASYVGNLPEWYPDTSYWIE